MTPTIASVLHLEDSELDAELVRDRLEKSGLPVVIELVSNRKNFVEKLKQKRYDLILSDYQVPTFEGLAALDLAHQYQPDTPFIFVSGTMGEDFAIETLKRGATDYLLKQRLIRLPAAVERALAESQARTERRRAEARASKILENLTEAFVILDADWRIVYVNAAFESITQSRRADLLGKNYWQVYPEAVGTKLEGEFRRVVAEGVTAEFESYSVVQARWFAIKAYPADGSGMCFQARDVTAAKQASEDLRASEARLAKLLVDEKRHTALLEQVARASRSMSAMLSAESIARIVTQEARTLIGARVGVATLTPPHAEGQELQVVARDSGKIDSAGDPEPLFHQELAALVRRDNRPIRLPSRESGPDPCGRLAAPLIGHGGKPLGVLQLAAKEGEFTPEDEAVVMQLAALAGIGIENARLYELLREQDKRKDEFLATLAHELRNPLAPVRNGIQILKAVGGGDQGRKIWDMMERQIGHMVRLIDDLMDLSRITRGRVELRKERVELRTVVDSALEGSRPLIEAARHALSVRVPPQVFLDADLTRMAQVIANLLNNSAKYTPAGGRITLNADVEGDTVVISVTDTGDGIPAEMLPRVFDMFTQVGRTLERTQGGLGIGLTLVRRLVGMHNGTVEVHSPGLGLGTTFTVRLPIAPVKQAALPRSATGPQALPLRSLKVLVVDDNMDGAESLALLLSMGGHQTRTAHSGPEALTAARAFLPDVVFLDIGLPGMNGYEVAARLRAEAAHASIVLVALTGWGSEDDRRRSKEVGFDHHLTKPVSTDHLQNLLRELPAAQHSHC